MPKDKHGTELTIGQRVTLECVVTTVHDSEDDCNVMLTTIERFNGGNHCSTIHINSKQVAAVLQMTTGPVAPTAESTHNAGRKNTGAELTRPETIEKPDA